MSKPTRRLFMGAVPVAAAAATRVPVVVPTVLAPDIAFSNDPLKIVTMYKFEPPEIAKIKAANPKVPIDVAVCSSRAEFLERVKDAEVVYGALDNEALKTAAKCKWFQAGEAGMEKVLTPELRASNIVVTNYQRTFAPAISETAIGLLLCLTRGISQHYMPQFAKRQMRSVGTARSNHHVEISGRTMGIAGMGGIGTMLARRAHYGFDMKIIATDAKPLPKPEYVAELHSPEYMPTMAQQVDVLVSAVPHTPGTERMFNEPIFKA